MQNNRLVRTILNGTTVALAVLIVAKTGLVSGISCTDGLTLVVVVILMAALNALRRPLLLLLAMPLVIASFGLLLLPALWIANAIVLYIVGNTLGLAGFHVDSFKAAMWGSLWISIIAFLIGKLLGNDRPQGGNPGPGPGGRRREKPDDKDVIDV